MFDDEFKMTRIDEDDLLYAIMTMDILLRSGASIETAMEYVSSHDYGDVSTEFRWIIDETRRGMFLEEAVQMSKEHVKSKLYDDMANAIVRSILTSSGSANTLRQIALRESHQRRAKYKAFLDNVRGIGELFIIIGALIPLILGIVGFTNDIMSNDMMDDIGGNTQLMPPTVINFAFLGIALVLTVIVMSVHFMSPRSG